MGDEVSTVHDRTKQNVGALDFSLTTTEVDAIDGATLALATRRLTEVDPTSMSAANATTTKIGFA
jgi:hypothetical protein